MVGQWTFSGVKIYDAELNHYLNDPSGEVGQYLDKRAKLMVLGAKKQVGVDTGALRTSIYMIHERSGVFQQVRIGSNLRYAYEHHEGTRPHVITPRNHQMLRFSSGGRQIYTRVVMHPGTKPNRFLADQLALIHI